MTSAIRLLQTSGSRRWGNLGPWPIYDVFIPSLQNPASQTSPTLTSHLGHDCSHAGHAPHPSLTLKPKPKPKPYSYSYSIRIRIRIPNAAQFARKMVVVPESRASSLRPKAFLVSRLAHHPRRCRPLRPHHRPCQVCVPLPFSLVPSRPGLGSPSLPPPPRISRISRVLVTEIDFQTYLQQVDLVFNGQCDYARLVGDTGPLVCVLLLPLVLPTSQHPAKQAIQPATSAFTSPSNASSLPPHSSLSRPSTPPSISSPNT